WIEARTPKGGTEGGGVYGHDGPEPAGRIVEEHDLFVLVAEALEDRHQLGPAPGPRRGDATVLTSLPLGVGQCSRGPNRASRTYSPPRRSDPCHRLASGRWPDL